ncbi:DUF202 domain-containing protein [Sphingomonas lenta]|uniref:DUF202 domain-containing protein n=1 Tax=Sphingomonas lenta TaxID=1141887 RepID=A0A2A2SJ52_9SPHN|nr:DUF202 domain-containing protein [Sphingomonas lenta]PAX09253.1 hypothetical protein CKY28_00335 [Sphingomonas lenta]
MADDHPRGEKRTELADDRTSLASDRTMLASERTLAAWWRTVIASLAAAIALVKIYEEVEPAWAVRAAATVPVALALVILFVAARRYTRTAKRIESECVERVPRAELWVGTALLFLLCLAAGWAVWTLR